jgi:hypothetical protein
MEIHSVAAELFHAERDRWTDIQTDMMEPVVAIRNFANAPKNGQHKIIAPSVDMGPLIYTLAVITSALVDSRDESYCNQEGADQPDPHLADLTF